MNIDPYHELKALLVIVGFVVYPFVVAGLTSFIRSQTVRGPMSPLAAKLSVLIGAVGTALFAVWHGLHPLLQVNVIGSTVAILAFAATGGLLGAFADWLLENKAIR